MNESSKRATALYKEIKKHSTEEILRKYLPEVLRKAEHSDPWSALPTALTLVLQERGVIPIPPERPSERAMRLGTEDRQRAEAAKAEDPEGMSVEEVRREIRE